MAQIVGAPTSAAPKTDEDRKRDIWRVLRLGMGSTAGWDYSELEEMYADPDQRAWVKFAESKLTEYLAPPRQGDPAYEARMADCKAYQRIVSECELLIDKDMDMEANKDYRYSGCTLDCFSTAFTPGMDKLGDAEKLPEADDGGDNPAKKLSREVCDLMGSLYYLHHPHHFTNLRANAFSMAAFAQDSGLLRTLLSLAPPVHPGAMSVGLVMTQEPRRRSMWTGDGGAAAEAAARDVVLKVRTAPGNGSFGGSDTDLWRREVLGLRRSYVSPLAAAVLSGNLENVKILLELAARVHTVEQEDWASAAMPPPAWWSHLGPRAYTQAFGRHFNRNDERFWTHGTPDHWRLSPCFPDELCGHNGYVFTPLAATTCLSFFDRAYCVEISDLLRKHGAVLPTRVEYYVAPGISPAARPEPLAVQGRTPTAVTQVRKKAGDDGNVVNLTVTAGGTPARFSGSGASSRRGTNSVVPAPSVSSDGTAVDCEAVIVSAVRTTTTRSASDEAVAAMWPCDKLLRRPASLDASYKQLLVFSTLFSINVGLACAVKPFMALLNSVEMHSKAAQAEQQAAAAEQALEVVDVAAADLEETENKRWETILGGQGGGSSIEEDKVPKWRPELGLDEWSTLAFQVFDSAVQLMDSMASNGGVLPLMSVLDVAGEDCAAGGWAALLPPSDRCNTAPAAGEGKRPDAAAAAASSRGSGLLQALLLFSDSTITALHAYVLRSFVEAIERSSSGGQCSIGIRKYAPSLQLQHLRTSLSLVKRLYQAWFNVWGPLSPGSGSTQSAWGLLRQQVTHDAKGWSQPSIVPPRELPVLDADMANFDAQCSAVLAFRPATAHDICTKIALLHSLLCDGLVYSVLPNDLQAVWQQQRPTQRMLVPPGFTTTAAGTDAVTVSGASPSSPLASYYARSPGRASRDYPLVAAAKGSPEYFGGGPAAEELVTVTTLLATRPGLKNAKHLSTLAMLVVRLGGSASVGNHAAAGGHGSGGASLYDRVDKARKVRRVLRQALRSMPKEILQAIVAADDEPLAMRPDDLVSELVTACSGKLWRTAEDAHHLAACSARSSCYLGVKLSIHLGMAAGLGTSSVAEQVQRTIADLDGYMFLDNDTLLTLAQQDPLQVVTLLSTVPMVVETSFVLQQEWEEQRVERSFASWFVGEAATYQQSTSGSGGASGAALTSSKAAPKNVFFRSFPGLRQLQEDAEDVARNGEGHILTHSVPRAWARPLAWLLGDYRYTLPAYMSQGPSPFAVGIAFIVVRLVAHVVFGALGSVYRTCDAYFRRLARRSRQEHRTFTQLIYQDQVSNLQDLANLGGDDSSDSDDDDSYDATKAAGSGAAAEDDAGVSVRSTLFSIESLPLPANVIGSMELLELVLESDDVHVSAYGSPAIHAMINFRWHTFTKGFLQFLLLDHLVFMGVFIAYAQKLTETSAYDAVRQARAANSSTADDGGDICVPLDHLQMALLVSIACFAFTYFLQEGVQMLRNGPEELKKPWNLLDWTSIGLSAYVIIASFSGNCLSQASALRQICSIEVLVLFLRLLYYSMANSQMGSFFRMVIDVVKELVYFFAFLTIIWAGFAVAIWVLEPGSKTSWDFFAGTSRKLFTMIFGDFQTNDLESDPEESIFGSAWLSRVYAATFMMLVVILLLNLLIAIINDTYEKVKEVEEYEAIRNKAIIILETEALVPEAIRRRRDVRLGLNKDNKWLHLVRVVTAERRSGGDRDDPNAEYEDGEGFLVSGNKRCYNGYTPSGNAAWKGRVQSQKASTQKAMMKVQAQLAAEMAAMRQSVPKEVSTQMDKKLGDMEKRITAQLDHIAAARGLPSLNPAAKKPAKDTGPVRWR